MVRINNQWTSFIAVITDFVEIYQRSCGLILPLAPGTSSRQRRVLSPRFRSLVTAYIKFLLGLSPARNIHWISLLSGLFHFQLRTSRFSEVSWFSFGSYSRKYASRSHACIILYINYRELCNILNAHASGLFSALLRANPTEPSPGTILVLSAESPLESNQFPDFSAVSPTAYFRLSSFFWWVGIYFNQQPIFLHDFIIIFSKTKNVFEGYFESKGSLRIGLLDEIARVSHQIH